MFYFSLPPLPLTAVCVFYPNPCQEELLSEEEEEEDEEEEEYEEDFC